MTRRRLAWAGLPLAGAALAVSIAVTARGSGSPPPQATGSATRLGPHDGQLVSDYLAATRRALAGLGGADPGYALVALDGYTVPEALPALLGGTPMVRALVRAPVRRVQTRIVELPARTPADVRGGMVGAARDLDGQAAAEPGSGSGGAEAAAVDRAQAALLRQGCACVVAVVVRAAPDALRHLAARTGVRAVDPAPAGEPLARLAFAPLLPDQRGRVEPPPDDGAAVLLDGASPGSGASPTRSGGRR